MVRNFDLASAKALNIGNSYTYTVVAGDHEAYSAFFVTTGSTITLSDGVNSVNVTVAANEEIALNATITTIVDTADNNIVFIY